jgi:hypothetical protein
METVAGSMSRIDYATNGDRKFSFARELTNIARATIFTYPKEPMSDALPELEPFHHAPFLDVSHSAFRWHLSPSYHGMRNVD